MLTPEERQRIEEEESRKLSEEQYRAEVRARLRQETAQEQRSGTPGSKVRRAKRIAWILGISTVFVIGAVIVTHNRSASRTSDGDLPSEEAPSNFAPVPKTRYVPVSEKIATGQITVRANGYVQYRIILTPEMIEPRISGSFNASGGGGNDIEAVIADETNYMNWINGHQAQVFWGTQGKQTTGSIDVGLRPGTYYLVFSNRFSVFTQKQVFLEVNLNYKKAETYY